MSTMSSSQIVSATAMQNRPHMFGTPGITGNAVPMHAMITSPGEDGLNTLCGWIVELTNGFYFVLQVVIR